MPREVITISAGQCGNQIGKCFWDLLLQEHSFQKQKSTLFDAALSSFFKNYDEYGNHISKDFKKNIHCLKARSLIVDTEEGVINQIFKSNIADLFDLEEQVIKDVSGAGNNWAHANASYGPQLHDEISNKLRREVEEADSLQCFFLFHSLGGGTGSGLGTYILELLADEYPEVFRFTTSVYPSQEDDVIVSPYNSLLASQKLIEFADCVFPMDNDSLLSITQTKGQPDKEQKKEIYGKMNQIVGHLLSNLTSSMRFSGKLNVDLNEITMNLVPFPKLHFLISSMSPIQTILQKQKPRSLNDIFKEVLLSQNQVVSSQPLQRTYLALGLLLRGQVSYSDVSYNIEKIKQQAKMIWWNQEGFKFGICDQKPLNSNYSLLCLANNTSVEQVFSKLHSRFQKLYKKKNTLMRVYLKTLQMR